MIAHLVEVEFKTEAFPLTGVGMGNVPVDRIVTGTTLRLIVDVGFAPGDSTGLFSSTGEMARALEAAIVAALQHGEPEGIVPATVLFPPGRRIRLEP